MHRNVRWIVSAGMLLSALTAFAQERNGVFTTLPRPAVHTQPPGDVPPAQPGYGPIVPLPGSAPEAIDTAPTLPPIGCGPDVPFYRRVRADLVEAAILFPVIHQSLNAAVDVSGGIGTVDVRLPMASLGVSAPFIANIQFDAWRYGELNLGYKLLSAEGNAILLQFDPAGPAILRSRLDMSVVDLNFASSGYGPLWNLLWFLNRDPVKPEWGLRWDLGARVATVFMDSTAFGPTREQHISSFFVGGGPHLGLTLHHTLSESGLMLFSRLDLGSNMGTVNQQYSHLERDAVGDPIGFGYASRTDFRWVPTLTAQLGIGGEPPFTRRGRWQVAYQFEQWWGVGSAHGVPADLVTHGAVLRWWWQY